MRISPRNDLIIEKFTLLLHIVLYFIDTNMNDRIDSIVLPIKMRFTRARSIVAYFQNESMRYLPQHRQFQTRRFYPSSIYYDSMTKNITARFENTLVSYIPIQSRVLFAEMPSAHQKYLNQETKHSKVSKPNTIFWIS